jgi:hypothetical protein
LQGFFSRRNALLKELRMHEIYHQALDSLLPSLHLESVSEVDPVVAHHVPSPWQVLGCGNYAAVLCHPAFDDVVVKIYAPGRPGLEEEVRVYEHLGQHPSFSECLCRGDNFLILKRMYGVTLYDCVLRGIRIPSQVITDIDEALRYSISQGLTPHDVHGRNIMLSEGRGVIVDVSDFLIPEGCGAWEDIKRAYFWVYRPWIYPFGWRVPAALLNLLRFSYRKSRRVRSWISRT